MATHKKHSITATNARKLKLYNKSLHPAYMKFRTDCGRFQFFYQRNGFNIRRNLTMDIEQSYDTALALREEIASKQQRIGPDGLRPKTNRKLTLEQWYSRWSEEHYKNIKPTTSDNYKIHWNSISSRLKQQELHTLTSKLIVDEFESIKKQSMREHAAVMLNVILNAAVRKGVLSKNPWRASYKSVKKNIPIYSPDELSNIFMAATENARLGLALAGFMGLRLGEIMGLQAGDVDLKNHLIYIRRTRISARGKWGLVQDSGKTDQSLRVIPILDPVVPFLVERMNNKNRTDFLYPKYTNQLRNRLKTACKRVGVAPITLHELRHICGSNLAMHGGPALAQSFLGHSSIKTTMDVYSHLTAPFLKKQADQLYSSNIDMAEYATLAEQILKSINLNQQKNNPDFMKDVKKLAKFVKSYCTDLHNINKKSTHDLT